MHCSAFGVSRLEVYVGPKQMCESGRWRAVGGDTPSLEKIGTPRREQLCRHIGKFDLWKLARRHGGTHPCF